jgi:hypothetical protein
VHNVFFSRLLSKNLKTKIYRTIILPVVLYGCESWTLTLKRESRLRVFENRVLRKIVGLKRDEVTRKWRKWRTRCRWEDNIRMDFQEVRYGDWTGLGWLSIERVGG